MRLCLLMLAVCGNLLRGASSVAGEFLAVQITREQLAKKLVEFAQAPIDARQLHAWVERLAEKEPVKADASFEDPPQVREVALAVLEAITGETFSIVKAGKITKIKSIVTYRIGDTPWRFHIASPTDEGFETVARNVEYWIAGYEAGLKKHRYRR